MSFINYQAERKILLMTRGHPFDREAFYAVFDGMEDIYTCAVEQPASQVFFQPELAADYDAFVLYDMPGMDFFQLGDDGLAPTYIEPPARFKQHFLALLERGHGFVFLHHAIAAWPGWPEYAEIVGGRFLYKPDTVRGELQPDSGYRHDVTHNVSVLAEHPVTDGVEREFSITDELYLAHAFADDITPLLGSDYHYTSHNFYSAQQAVQGNMFSRDGWEHLPGHNLVGWVKRYRNSPIVYLQCGDSAAAYENPNYRKLLRNAIDWVSSDEAKAWAKNQPSPV